MSKHTQDAADLATVRRDGDPSVIVGREDGVENALGASVLSAGGLACLPVPQLVVLGESWLDLPAGKKVMDVRPVATVIAGVG